MQYVWDEEKRLSNLKTHGIDFVDAETVLEGLTFTFEDDREAYGEQRYVTLGLLKGIPVSIAHTESAEEIRVISFRKATSNETEIFFTQIKDQLPTPPVTEERRNRPDRRAPRGEAKPDRKGHRSARPKGRST